MRQVLLGLFGVLAAGCGPCRDLQLQTSVINGTFNEQTLNWSEGPKSNGARACAKRLRAERTGHSRIQTIEGKQHLPAVTCAAGQPIEFYPNGTLAECVLHSQQVPNVPGIAACKGRVRFDKDGRVAC